MAGMKRNTLSYILQWNNKSVLTKAEDGEEDRAKEEKKWMKP